MKKLFSFRYILLFLLTLSVLGFLIIRVKLPTILDLAMQPVTVVTKVVAEEELKSTDGRTNILILGTDQRSGLGGHVTSTLTDTIMIISLDKEGENPVLISIPRDLWVSKTNSKINAAFVLTRSNYLNELRQSGQSVNDDEVQSAASDAGLQMIKEVAEDIIGVPIHYHVFVGFGAFTEAIDTLGGLEVEVERSFTDYMYPIEGKEADMCGVDLEDFDEEELEEFNEQPIQVSFPCRYQTISFTRGTTQMDGETALKFARSRHAPQDGNDFNRARRQQQIVAAVKNKVLSTETLFNPVRIKDLHESYKNNIKTDIALTDAILFYDSYKDTDFRDFNRIVLSDEPNVDYLGSGMLISPSIEERASRYGGQYVLVPVSRTYDQIHALIRQVFFESTEIISNDIEDESSE